MHVIISPEVKSELPVFLLSDVALMNMISTVGINSTRVKRNYIFETVCFPLSSLA